MTNFMEMLEVVWEMKHADGRIMSLVYALGAKDVYKWAELNETLFVAICV
jgi:hypothetical protein